MARWLGFTSFALLSFVAVPARAEDLAYQWALGAGVGYVRQLPNVEVPSTLTPAREIREGKLALPGGLPTYGVHFDTAMTFSDRWHVPLLGAALYGALGSHDTRVTSYDGSILRTRPWTAVQLQLLLPGIGYRWKHRRNQVALAVRTGFTFFRMQGTIIDGSSSTDVALDRATALLQLEVEACRRLDPETRVCLQVAPRIYEYEFGNGGTIGVRVEFGQ